MVTCATLWFWSAMVALLATGVQAAPIGDGFTGDSIADTDTDTDDFPASDNYDDDYYLEDIESARKTDLEAQMKPLRQFIENYIETYIDRMSHQFAVDAHTRQRHANADADVDGAGDDMSGYQGDQGIETTYITSVNGGNFENLGKIYVHNASVATAPDAHGDLFFANLNTTLSKLIGNSTIVNHAHTVDLFGEKRNSTDSEIRKRYRAITKESWKNELKQRILDTVGRTELFYPNASTASPLSFDPKKNNIYFPNIPNIPIIPESVDSKDAIPNLDYTEKIQSFYPKCEIPRNTDQESWKETTNMNLLFNINITNAQEGYALNIAKATLRLFKLAQNQSNVQIEGHAGKDTDSPTLSFLEKEDRQIRVSIYWYTRSLRKHRVKRRLSDSKMVHIYDSKIVGAAGEWIEFNIRPAAKSWMKTGRNLGLGIVVDDQEGNILPADRYFKNIDCQNNNQASQIFASVKPVPRPLFEAAALRAQSWRHKHTGARSVSDTGSESGTDGHQADNNTRQPGPNAADLSSFLLFPTVDLCTFELPANSEKAKINEIQRSACHFKEINYHFLDHKDMLNILHGSNEEAMKYNLDTPAVDRVLANTTELLQNDSPVQSDGQPLLEHRTEAVDVPVTDAASRTTEKHKKHRHHHGDISDPRNGIVNQKIVVSKEELMELLEQWKAHETNSAPKTDR